MEQQHHNTPVYSRQLFKQLVSRTESDQVLRPVITSKTVSCSHLFQFLAYVMSSCWKVQVLWCTVLFFLMPSFLVHNMSLASLYLWRKVELICHIIMYDFRVSLLEHVLINWLGSSLLRSNRLSSNTVKTSTLILHRVGPAENIQSMKTISAHSRRMLQKFISNWCAARIAKNVFKIVVKEHDLNLIIGTLFINHPFSFSVLLYRYWHDHMDWSTPDHPWSRNSAWTEHTHSGSTHTDCWTEGPVFTIWCWMASCGWEHLAVDKHSVKFFKCYSSTRVGSRLLRNSRSCQVQRWNSNITIHRCTHGNCSSNT